MKARNLLFFILLSCWCLLPALGMAAKSAADLKKQASIQYSGIGTPVNYAQALNLYLQAAKLGDTEAMFIAGGMLYKGMGAAKSPKRAADLLLQAADLGYYSPESAQILGSMYLWGKGVPQNYQQAEIWLEEAAADNNMEACNDLAYMHYNGLIESGEPDFERALDLYTRAGKQGSELAQVNLGLMYAEGVGTNVDFVQAYAWYAMAASQGNREAPLQQSKLMMTMTWDELQQAQVRSLELFRLGAGGAKKK